MKEMDAEDRFVTSIADELQELPHRERLLAKNEIKAILFRYQMQVLEKESNNNNNANNPFSFFQQGHQMLNLPEAFDATRVNMLQNQQQQNLFNNTYNSPESTMFSSPAPSPSFPPVSYRKELENEQLQCNFKSNACTSSTETDFQSDSHEKVF